MILEYPAAAALADLRACATPASAGRAAVLCAATAWRRRRASPPRPPASHCAPSTPGPV
ncbi:hypothetical protein SGLAM104S_07020 [Streptomyces glaucescens]